MTIKYVKLFFLHLFCLFLLISCNENEQSVQIIGKIKNSNLKRVYLTDSYQWDVLLDSCDVVNNSFVFDRKKIDFLTYSIYYKDSIGNLHSLEYVNRVLSPNAVKFLTNYFMLDSSKILIHGDWKTNNNHYYEVITSEENKALFRTQMMNFGDLNPDTAKRTKQLNEYLEIIKEFPSSNYLLSQLNSNKSLATKHELQLLLSKFSTKTLNSSLGMSLKNYVKNKTETVYFDNVELKNTNGDNKTLLDNSAKVNMLIFWASWCGPCRQEVPVLKNLFNQFSDKGLTMTSVSIDESKKEWLEAIEIEKMPWPQLIIPSEKLELIKARFEIAGIPYVIFTDSNGKLISRTIGSEKGDYELYKKLIEKNLK